MKPWYRNSTLMMDDAEMEWLQSQDAGSCAVWEWLKSDCQKRGTSKVRELPAVETSVVARRLGIDSPRFSQVSQNLHALGWITPDGEIRGWAKWQSSRTPEEDAARKQLDYWKAKALELEKLQPMKATEKAEPPTVSQSLPKTPLEERRGEESIGRESLSGGTTRNPDFPKNLLEVFTEADMRGIPRTVAEEFWNHFESSGWIDRHGHPIAKWRPKLLTWATRERAVPAESAHNGKDKFWKSKFEFDMVQAEIKKIVGGKATDAMGTMHIDEPTRVRLAELRGRMSELKKALGL